MLLVFSLFSWISDPHKNDRWALFVVDTSLSMSVADIAWTQGALLSRVDTTKKILSDMSMTRPSALMTFASSAKLQLPLSTDERVWDEVIGAIDVIRYGSPTDIGSALASAMLIYSIEPMDIYLLTDGEGTSTENIGTWVSIPRHTRLHIIGIGTENGGKIINNYDGSGRAVYKQYEWKDIISRLDRDNIKFIADQYGASFDFIEDESDIMRIQNYIASNHPSLGDFSSDQTLLILASFFIIVGMVIPDYRKK